MRIIRLADCPEVPWRNGAGTTRELLLEPDLRVTVAYERSGAAFSDFSGWSRTIVPLGAGFSLRLGERGEHAIPAFQAFAFAGAERARASLAAGPIEALNIMTRDGALAHRVVPFPHAPSPEAPLHSMLCFLARGALRLAGAALEAGTLALAEDAADREELARASASLPPEAILLAFQIERPSSIRS
uniref:HutD family protein n=1 Tax=mine drainage metagenome TaxID=410659 RepID=E6Q820_9ZZZZ